MKKQTSYVGGFAATNMGTIQNSYSLVEVSKKNYTVGGFVGQNKGEIESSFCDFKLDSVSGVFTGEGTENLKSCYFFYEDRKIQKRIEKLEDKERAKQRSEVRDEKQANELAFDTEEIWEFTGETPILKFKSREWIYDTEEIFEAADQDEVFEIGTATELFDFADKVNSGSIIYREAHIKLSRDIDLGGREWVPIGETLRRSFTGVFDGCGHTVSNFLITDTERENKGFFGFISGSVFNLTVDCMIQGDGCIGGLAAQNLSGIIGCCGAVVSIKKKEKKGVQSETALAIGGLVGHNTGTIFESYTAGKISFVAIILFWPIIGVAAGTVALTGAIIAFNLPYVVPDDAPIFNKIPEELLQTEIEGDEEEPRTDSNFVSFQFNKEIIIDLDSGTCTLDYKNPGNSNHNTIVELQITDQVAVDSMGATGRDAQLQSEYEAREDYDPSAFRVTIAKSDSVSPGYQVSALSLSDFAKQNMAPGTYDAVIMIYPYDTETNNKAMLESQLPVSIVVQ